MGGAALVDEPTENHYSELSPDLTVPVAVQNSPAFFSALFWFYGSLLHCFGSLSVLSSASFPAKKPSVRCPALCSRQLYLHLAIEHCAVNYS